MYYSLQGINGKSRAIRPLLLCIFLAAVAIASHAAADPLVRTELVMDTPCTITLPKGGNQAIMDEVFDRLKQIDAELSEQKPDSEIAKVNAAAGIHPVKVGDDALAMIKRDLRYAAMSDGAFDPSVGPLVKLWGIGTDHARLPSKAEIAAALALVNWKDVVVDKTAKTIFLKRKGMSIDLGSGTKGYATDAVVDILRAKGISQAIIDLGGNIFVMGSKDGGKPWNVGLQTPGSDRGDYLGIAKLSDMTMVTSGIYERFFIQDGVRYHHIFDTKTGYPVQNGLVSLTIVTKKSFDADGCTTMLFALGREKGMALGEKMGLDLIVVDDANKVYLSSGVSKYFQLADPLYKLAE